MVGPVRRSRSLTPDPSLPDEWEGTVQSIYDMAEHAQGDLHLALFLILVVGVVTVFFVAFAAASVNKA